ncbi:TonB-dependent siderophore receptor [Steroidobacter flavus]|uniref:TonB-dependent siderophore receptor n=1 Tax=Steroidobacter flavus TaxID=1842136 RepID=A0ABV8T4V6_9GAMM
MLEQMSDRRWPSRALSLAVTAVLLAPLAAVAADSTTADAKTLGKIRVDGATEVTTENNGSYAATAVTLAKGGQELREIPQSVSVITRQRLDDQNINSLPEALKNTTGVTVQRGDGSGFFNSSYARGYTTDSFQLDGLNVRSESIVADLDLAIYDRVEVMRGAAGLFKGTGEPGLTVNLARKRALETAHFNSLLSGGSWDSYRGELDVTGALNDAGTVRARGVAVYEDRDSYLDHSPADKQVIYGTLETDLTESTTLSVGGTYQEVDAVFNQGLPAYADGRLLDVARSTALVSDWNVQDMENMDLFAELEQRLDNGGQFKVAVRRQNRDMFYQGMRGAGAVAANGDVRLQYLRLDFEQESTGADVFLSTPFEWLGRGHVVTVGADYSKLDKSEDRTPDSTVATTNVFNHNFQLVEPQWVDTTATDEVLKAEEYGFYGQLRLSATDSLTFIAGGRVSWWESTVRNPVTRAVLSDAEAESEFTPYAAVVYDLTDALTLYASYTDIFKPQNQRTALGTQLEPRTGTQYEAGVKGEFLARRLNASAAVFRIEDENRSIADVNNAGFFVPIGEARSQGFETEVSGLITPAWNLTAGYAFTETEFIRGATAIQTGQPLSTLTPKHAFTLWTTYTLPDHWVRGLDVGGGVRTSSGVYSDAGTVRFESGGYSIVSARVGYRITERLNASLNVNNVFDKNYYERVTNATRQNYYGEPMNFTLTLRASF